MKIKPVSIGEAEYSAYYLAKKLMAYDEPIPDFSTRYPGKLEACLNSPFQSFNGKPLHRTLVNRATIMFYSIIKNHPFLNGNKRMAVMITLLFFFNNKKWLEVSPHELYEVACDVAKSKSGPATREVHLRALNLFFKSHLKDI